MADEAGIIDGIYEAGVNAERWPAVLEGLTQIGGGVGASFVTGGRWPIRWIATPVIEQLIQDYTKQPHRNVRLPLVSNRHEPTFMNDFDLLPAAAIEADPFYTEFMRPRGFGWCIGTAIHAPGADPIIFAVERAYSAGPAGPALIARFNTLRPHLGRAMLLSARLGMERARGRMEALDLVGYPAALVNERGKLLLLNGLFEGLIPAAAEDRTLRLTFKAAEADRLFADALAELKRRPGARVQSFPLAFPVAGDAARPPAAAHLLPVRKTANDLLSPGFALLLVTPLEPGPGPDVELIEALFDLTPAEARVARRIARAEPLDAIAAALGVSRETVRAQLKAVFDKTGLRRQAELVRLLSSLPSLPHENRTHAPNGG